jgi:hypothetical protein
MNTAHSQSVTPVPGSASSAADAVIGDMNGDGHGDVVTLQYGATSVVGVALNDHTNHFPSRMDYPAGADAEALTLADVDRDGDLDVAVADYTSNEVAVLKNDGHGNLGAPVFYTTACIGPDSITSADLNGDGFPDLVITCQGNDAVEVLQGGGAGGTFTAGPAVPACTEPYQAAVTDADRDERPDLAVVCHAGEAAWYMRNTTVFPTPTLGAFATAKVRRASFRVGGTVATHVQTARVYLYLASGRHGGKLHTVGAPVVLPATAGAHAVSVAASGLKRNHWYRWEVVAVSRAGTSHSKPKLVRTAK